MNLIKRSIELDLEFIKLGLPAGDKLAFIIKKYSLLIKNFVFGFTKNKSYISVFKRKYYFDDRFGIAFLQSVYIDNAFLKNYVPPNATIVDIGGNIGQFRFFCENYLSTEKVYSFEPVKETYKTLVLNFPYSSFNLAITEEDRLDIFIPGTSLMSSSFRQTENDKIESVECKKLDDIQELKNEAFIDLLKIDTEGSELDVLKSGLDILKKSKYILVEASLARESSGDLVELISWLKYVLPNVKIVEMGRPYLQNNIQSAVDILLCNNPQQ